jgi:hypothetical protein
MLHADCPFCNSDASEILAANEVGILEPLAILDGQLGVDEQPHDSHCQV